MRRLLKRGLWREKRERRERTRTRTHTTTTTTRENCCCCCFLRETRGGKLRRRRRNRERERERLSLFFVLCIKKALFHHNAFENWIPKEIIVYIEKSTQHNKRRRQRSLLKKNHHHHQNGRRQPAVQNARVHQLPGSRDDRRREAHRGKVFSLRSTHEFSPRRRRGVSKTEEYKEE